MDDLHLLFNSSGNDANGILPGNFHVQYALGAT